MSFSARIQTTDTQNYVTPFEECKKDVNHSISGLYCNATWDTITCWPPTRAGHVAVQPCPPIFGADFDKSVYKKCGADGKWAIVEFWEGFGHSDYGQCIDHIQIDDVFDIEETGAEPGLSTYQINITKGIVAVAILTVSLMLLLVSIISVNFIIPRAVNQAPQYKICRYMFPVFIFDTLVNLVEKICFLFEIHYGLSYKTLTNTSTMCEMLIAVKEYAHVTTYMWLLLQCHHLQNRTAADQYSSTSMLLYCVLGWGIPVIPATIWVMTTALSHKVTCWTGYKFLKIMWILDSSKLVILLGTILILLYSIRQLMKTTGITEDTFRGKEKNCCYKRIWYETISCSLFVFYIVIVLLVTLLYNHTSSSRNQSERGDLARIITESCKGIMLTMSFWAFNLDIRSILEVNIRRISQQHLVPSPSAIEENVV